MSINNDYVKLDSSFDVSDDAWIDIPKKHIVDTTKQVSVSTPDKIVFGNDSETNNKLLANLLAQLTKLTSIKKIPTKNIEDIINLYDKNVLIQFLLKYINSDVIKQVIPFIEIHLGQPIIFTLVGNKVSILNIRKLDVNMCKLDTHNKTILFYIKNPKYLLDFLELDTINPILNHTNDDFTFFDFFQHNNYQVTKNDSYILDQIISILNKKKFNFTSKHFISGMSLLDRAFMLGYHSNETGLESIYKIIKNCRIMSSNLFWINILVKNCNNNCKLTNTILTIVLERDDYKSFINDLITRGTNKNDILHIFSHLMLESRIKEMLEEQNELGSNALHLLSIKHYDTIIRLLYIKLGEDYMETLNIKNVNGDYPLDLYNKYKIKNLLSKSRVNK